MKNYCLLLISALVLSCCALFVVSCKSLPQDIMRLPSMAIKNSQDTFWGQLFLAQGEKHQGLSGLHLLSGGLDAFVARAVLTEYAEKSIDVQYYMFHQDTVGNLLINSLLQAADRGVRVRMLIDDMYGPQADNVWTTLENHPNIEVRMFNPFVRGSSQKLQWLTRFGSVSHRMHSKSFTVDNSVTIVGGRNIGDEYFNANPELAFADLDVLAAGPVAEEVSTAFDEYWNSTFSYPISSLNDQHTPGSLPALRKTLRQLPFDESAAAYINALQNSPLATQLKNDSVNLEWSQAKIFSDPVDKRSSDENKNKHLLISQLWDYIDNVEKELLLITPYFVPGKDGTEALCRLSRRGVRIRVLTNSLASNDVAAVHAGYSRYRKQLLQAGIELFELDEEIKKEVGKSFFWLPGLSKSSLHAKTMILDRKMMFVGSMNLDQLSLNINNEIGMLFSNDGLAGESARSFDDKIENIAFRLQLADNAKGKEQLFWHLKKKNLDLVFEKEPYVGFWKKCSVFLIGLLPVEKWL